MMPWKPVKNMNIFQVGKRAFNWQPSIVKTEAGYEEIKSKQSGACVIFLLAVIFVSILFEFNTV